MKLKSNNTTSQNNFSGIAKREVKQEIIAHSQKRKRKITNKNTKTIIHIGKNTNAENPIL